MKNNLIILWRDSLFRNSFYLILATAVMAVLGFIFWLIVAKFFITSDIGLATTLISVMNMIAIFSLLGFDVAFVRFLPHSTDQNRKINTGMTIVSIMAVLLGSIFVIFVDNISPSLNFINNSLFSSAAFIFFCIMTATNILTDSIFVSHRKTKYTFIINTIFCLLRILLPFALISSGAMGIFASVALSQTIGLVLSIGLLVWKFGYRPSFVISRDILIKLGSYSANNYIAGIFNLLPATILPIIVLNKLGPEKAAIFYMVVMLGNLLYAVPWATTRAFFAEGVHNKDALPSNGVKSAKIIYSLMTPAILILFFYGDWILRIFGKTYSAEGFNFLRIIAATGLIVGIYAILGSFFRIKKNQRWFILINFSYAATIIIMSFLLLPYGLTGIGIAWFLGYAVASLVGYAVLHISGDVASLELKSAV